MLLMLIIIFFNFSNLLQNSLNGEPSAPGWVIWMLLFVIGIYGGFIQLGIRIFLLSALILIINMSFNHANALKNLMNFFLTIPAFIIFAIHGQVKWEYGLILASGQMTGAWLAAKFSLEFKESGAWIRWLLILMTIITSIELLGVRQFFFK